MRKNTSTMLLIAEDLDGCGMAVSLSVIGGRAGPSSFAGWAYGPVRYSELEKFN